MTVIIDNENPNRRPSAPVATGPNDSVPDRSDSIQYTGGLFHAEPFKYQGLGDAVCVTFKKIARVRTWVNIAQFHTTPAFGGHYEERATEGVSTSVAVVQRWDASLGLSVTAGWGPLSASISAKLSVGGEKSVTVALFESLERSIQFNFDKGLDAEVAAWQLEEKFALNNWTYMWTAIPGGDPSKVTAAQILDAQNILETALKEGKKPPYFNFRVLPPLVFGSNQYTMTSYNAPPQVKMLRD